MRLMRLTGLMICATVAAQCGGGPAESPSAAPDAAATMASAVTPALEAGDWPMYRGAPGGAGYSPLDEITATNVGSLERAWTYDLHRETRGPDDRGPNSQVTPIVVEGVMYLPAADRVVALDPATGDEHWRHMTAAGAPSRRGVAWWPGDGTLGPRIIFTDGGTTLVALDAATGEPADGFGDGGAVDIGVPYNSVPLVHDDVVVVGANTPAGTIGGIGNARAFDARTGATLWEFDSVAQPGQPGHDTWAGDSWQNRLGANAWPFYFTVDDERSLLYVPLASPIPGYYGGDRAGDNLYGNAVVAVDLRTGAYRWHFQTIHHDLWDADPPAPPALFDIVSDDGTTVPALGVTTKSGYLYILNRETGEPIHGVEEQVVAQSDVPGEATAATQPIPVKPPPMGRVRYEAADLVTPELTSVEHAEACAALVDSLGEIVSEGPFTPWAYRASDEPRTTLNFPGGVGGPNWGGVTFDPATGVRRRLHDGRRRARLDGGRGRSGRPVALPERDAAARQLRGESGRRPDAVPGAAVGTVDRRRCGDGRHRLAGAGRRDGEPAGGAATDRPAGPRGGHRHWEWSAVHRSDRRQPLPGDRCGDRA